MSSSKGDIQSQRLAEGAGASVPNVPAAYSAVNDGAGPANGVMPSKTAPTSVGATPDNGNKAQSQAKGKEKGKSPEQRKHPRPENYGTRNPPAQTRKQKYYGKGGPRNFRKQNLVQKEVAEELLRATSASVQVPTAPPAPPPEPPDHGVERDEPPPLPEVPDQLTRFAANTIWERVEPTKPFDEIKMSSCVLIYICFLYFMERYFWPWLLFASDGIYPENGWVMSLGRWGCRFTTVLAVVSNVAYWWLESEFARYWRMEIVAYHPIPTADLRPDLNSMQDLRHQSAVVSIEYRGNFYWTESIGPLSFWRYLMRPRPRNLWTQGSASWKFWEYLFEARPQIFWVDLELASQLLSPALTVLPFSDWHTAASNATRRFHTVNNDRFSCLAEHNIALETFFFAMCLHHKRCDTLSQEGFRL